MTQVDVTVLHGDTGETVTDQRYLAASECLAILVTVSRLVDAAGRPGTPGFLQSTRHLSDAMSAVLAVALKSSGGDGNLLRSKAQTVALLMGCKFVEFNPTAQGDA